MQTTLGQALRQERESRGFSIDEISRTIQIQSRYLEAMEADDYSQLPPNLYLKYYIRSYLRFLNVDESAFFHLHQTELNRVMMTEGEPSLSQSLEKVRFSRFRKRRVLLITLVFLTLVTVIVLVFVKATDFQFFPENPLEATPESIGSAVSSHLPSTPQPQSPKNGIPKTEISVHIAFQDDCWLQVDSPGEPPVDKTYRKGDIFQFTGKSIQLLIGNPAAITLLINDQDHSSVLTPGKPQRLHLTPDTLPALSDLH